MSENLCLIIDTLVFASEFLELFWLNQRKRRDASSTQTKYIHSLFISLVFYQNSFTVRCVFQESFKDAIGGVQASLALLHFIGYRRVPDAPNTMLLPFPIDEDLIRSVFWCLRLADCAFSDFIDTFHSEIATLTGKPEKADKTDKTEPTNPVVGVPGGPAIGGSDSKDKDKEKPPAFGPLPGYAAPQPAEPKTDAKSDAKSDGKSDAKSDGKEGKRSAPAAEPSGKGSAPSSGKDEKEADEAMSTRALRVCLMCCCSHCQLRGDGL